MARMLTPNVETLRTSGTQTSGTLHTSCEAAGWRFTSNIDWLGL